jgi:hypothetical protein
MSTPLNMDSLEITMGSCDDRILPQNKQPPILNDNGLGMTHMGTPLNMDRPQAVAVSCVPSLLRGGERSDDAVK